MFIFWCAADELYSFKCMDRLENFTSNPSWFYYMVANDRSVGNGFPLSLSQFCQNLQSLANKWVVFIKQLGVDHVDSSKVCYDACTD